MNIVTSLPDDVVEALLWWQDTSQHNLDETACCRNCDACHLEQTKWRHIWNAERNLLDEVMTKYGINV